MDQHILVWSIFLPCHGWCDKERQTVCGLSVSFRFKEFLWSEIFSFLFNAKEVYAAFQATMELWISFQQVLHNDARDSFHQWNQLDAVLHYFFFCCWLQLANLQRLILSQLLLIRQLLQGMFPCCLIGSTRRQPPFEMLHIATTTTITSISKSATRRTPLLFSTRSFITTCSTASTLFPFAFLSKVLLSVNREQGETCKLIGPTAETQCQ